MADEDMIQSLPDFGPTPTPHYSGYLDASAGCDLATNGPICKTHYWLALAETSPLSKPVVLWLNGGPGSSSILGFMQELGPLLIDGQGGLMENPWSWTSLANLLVLESPLGVGYSHCSRQFSGKPCQNTDRYTASASRAALVDFFRKFPALRERDLYVTGESYAGVYSSSLNLKGIAVGDPCTDDTAQAESMDSLWYANKYGLMDEETYDLLWNTCLVRLPNLMSKGGSHLLRANINRELRVIVDPVHRRRRARELYHEVVLDGAFEKISQQRECTVALRKFLMSSSNYLSQSWKDLYIDDYSLFAPIWLKDDEHQAIYLSRPDVRRALHVEDAPTDTWPTPPVGFHYTSEYNACNFNDTPLFTSMVDIYREVAPQLRKTWIYNGDTDPCVSYEGTREAVKQIRFKELDGGAYRPWFYNHTQASLQILAQKSPLFGPNLVVQGLGSQLGGQVVDYEEGLKFVTFHGSGHMVPQFRPQAALHFLERFLGEDGLAPLLPNNETLAELDIIDFHKEMDDWTEVAKGSSYVNPTPLHNNDGVETNVALQ